MIVHIPGKYMVIVDYLSHYPYNTPWPASELDQKLVVATNNSFHKALDGINSRLGNTYSLNRNQNILEYSRRKVANKSSTPGCYGNLNGQKQAKPDRHEIKKFSRPPKQLNSSSQRERITFYSLQPSKQSSKKSAKSVQNSAKQKNPKTDSRKEMSQRNFNLLDDCWSDTPQEWRRGKRAF